MMFKLFLLFSIIPVLELGILIKLGSLIGVLNTITIIILTGITGAYLAKTQGISLLVKIQSNLQQGVLPSQELLEGLLIFAGGITLLTPGFFTDLIGLMLLLPQTRQILITLLVPYLKKHMEKGTWHQAGVFYHHQTYSKSPQSQDDNTIDV